VSIKIEKGIPVAAHGNGGKLTKYPFAEMEVGDSFLFPRELVDAGSRLFHWNRKFPDRKFVSRHTPEGIRCWRVA